MQLLKNLSENSIKTTEKYLLMQKFELLNAVCSPTNE